MERIKRLLLACLLCCFTFAVTYAQNYYIDFTASVTTTTLDSVYVENLTQGTSLSLLGSDTLHLYGTAGISSHNNNSSELKIYPNPFNETSHFEFYSETPTIAGIDAYDVVGKHILHLSQEIQRGTNIFEISGFSTGHYRLIIKTETWQKSANFISFNSEYQRPQIQLKSNSSTHYHIKIISKSTKNVVQMPYTLGDQLRFIGFSGLLSDIVNDVPTASKTIDFVFTAFTCGNTVTFNYGGNIVTYGTVLSSGNCWLDRNLGASQVAINSTDSSAYGDLFQWGRAVDGHQIRTSSTITTLSNIDTPGHGNFITTSFSPYDWRFPQNDNLWQGLNSVNNPCPPSWRIPTEAEWNTERLSWSSNNTAGAFASPLKLPLAGGRFSSNGSLNYVGSFGYYWSSSASDTYAHTIGFTSSNAILSTIVRANGYSLRCLKDN